MIIKSEDLNIVVLRFLSLHVFDPKLDHPDANVINIINNRLSLNPSVWKNDQPHLCVGKQQCFILFRHI